MFRNSDNETEATVPAFAAGARGIAEARISLSKRGMQNWVRAFLAACNAGDAARIAGYFEADATRYFPIGRHGRPCQGAQEIGRRIAAAVKQHACVWTFDQMLCEPDSRRAVLEWSMVGNTRPGVLRGTDWYQFSQCGLIQELRTYFAAAPDPAQAAAELQEFDYAGHGYAAGADVQGNSE
ncbi:MAG: nuclear transport factor 2 family protein [Nevskia sp.]|nr:nuclear transport factor 2 family protein [Nevskia sp.]